MDYLTILAAVGGFQGIIILLSILFRFRHRKNMPLALLLVVFSLRLATIPTWNPEILLAYPWIYPLTAPLPFLFAFLLWWYIRELTSDTMNPPQFFYIHFFPYFFEVIAISCTLLKMDRGEYVLFIDSVFSGNPPLWLLVRNGCKVVLNILYIVLSGRIAFEKKSKRLSNIKQLWVRTLVVVPFLILLAFAYVAVVPSATALLSSKFILPFFILAITMVLLIYIISFFLLIMPPGISIYQRKEHSEHSILLCSEIECKDILDMLEQRFAGGVWQNPDLVLSDIASEINIHPNRLSYAINHGYKVSFRCYLNSRRLEYFISRLKNGAHKKQSLLDLAFEAGFPSKSTFNRFFREKMGVSPSEYMHQFDSTIG